MNLAARRSATQHTNFVMRLWALFVSVALVFSLVIQPPKAKAFAAVGQLYTVVSSFLASCGLSWGVQGMDETGFGEQVARLLQDYLDTEFAGQTPLEWAGDVTVMATPQGKLQIPKMLVGKLADFTNWVIEKLGITAGGEAVEVGSTSGGTCTVGDLSFIPLNLPAYDGTRDNYSIGSEDDVIVGSVFSFPFSANLGNIELSVILVDDVCRVYKDGVEFIPLRTYTSTLPTGIMFFLYDGYLCFGFKYYQRSVHTYYVNVNKISVFKEFYGDTSISVEGTVDGSVSLNPATAIDVPDASTMADDEALEIGVGAAAGVALDVLLKQILDAILAGNLSATQEITKAEEQTKPGEITDVDELGLPALGAALTTRFPFSIPWDFVGAVNLLASPPKAPRWEVDLLAPIEERYGAFPGETKIIIDMSDYPLVGQISRWFTTLMFGWGLIMATKKLIWTT